MTLLLVGLCQLLSKGVHSLRRHKTTRLKGPASKSLIFGISSKQKDTSVVYEEWAEQHGSVLGTLIAMGASKVVLWDPTVGYIHNLPYKAT